MRTTRLRIALREVTPTVVRVLDVPTAATLQEVHQLLQVGIGWTDSHLHMFSSDDARYGIRSPLLDDVDEDMRDETTATLRNLPARFTYLYDFGDSWEHDIENLGTGDSEPGCLDGEGACPPEDCGGPHGYTDFRKALADPTHPEHEYLITWAGSWTDRFDRETTDVLVRETVGQVPASVRLLLDLLAGGTRLTPGGRLPRALVRRVHDARPDWYPLGRPASIEEDLLPLAALHDLLREAGLARLSRGVLTPTKAADDDLQIIRRLRRALRPESFHGVLIGVTSAAVAAQGPATVELLAATAHPWLGAWAVNGRPVTVDDVRQELLYSAATMEALDLIERDRGTWRAGPSATTLIPRATALARVWRADRS